jgi:hypothetical protein
MKVHHPFFIKYGIFLGLIFATGLNGALLYGVEKGWTVSGKTFNIVTTNRGSTQILVQILSHLLGLLSVISVTQLVNFSTRILALRITMTLDMITAWASLSSARIDWNLPLRFLIPTMIFAILAAGPSALWTGVLTPIVTTTWDNSTSRNIPVPVFSMDKYDSTRYWNRYQSLTNNESDPPIRNDRGVFTYAIAKNLLGPLMFSASIASSGNATWTHQKIDQTRYSYVGRSYGTGSSIGLLDDDYTQGNLVQGYTFQQRSYLPNVNCIKNQSALFWIQPVSTSSTIRIVAATGELPNSMRGEGEYSEYATIGDGEGVLAFGIATGQHRDNSSHVLAIAAGNKYADFNGTQCTMTFEPVLFQVSVNTTEKLVEVTPISATDDIEPSGNLQYLITRNVGDISIVGTGLYTSLLGDSLVASNSTYWAGAPSLGQLGQLQKDLILKGSENFLTSLLDDVIVAFGSAQLLIANDTVLTPVSLQVSAIQFGTRTYSRVSMAINCLILVLTLVEMIRTRRWRDLPFFDYTNVRHNIIASSAGGSDLAKAAQLEDGKAARRVNVNYKPGLLEEKKSLGMLILVSAASEEMGSIESISDVMDTQPLVEDPEMQSSSV